MENKKPIKKQVQKQSYFTDREMILIKVLKEQFTKMMNEQEIVLKNQIKKELRNSNLIKSLIKEVINENRTISNNTNSNNSIISKKQIIQKQNNQKQELLKKTFSKDPLINNILKNTVNELTSNDFEDDEEDFDEDYARQNQIITPTQKKQVAQKIANNIESVKKQIPEKLNSKLNNYRNILEEQFNSTEDNSTFVEDQIDNTNTQNTGNDVDITNIASFLGNKNMKDFALKHQSRPSTLKIEDTEII